MKPCVIYNISGAFLFAVVVLCLLLFLQCGYKSLTCDKAAKFVEVVSWAGGLGMFASIFIAVGIRFCYGNCEKLLGAYILLGFWALIPPIWFFLEWVFLRKYLVNENRKKEDIKYTQGLARNIWIALVVVLAAILGIKWPTE